MEIYMRLKTRDGKLAFEQVNEETFARRHKAVDDSNEQRYVADEYLRIDGQRTEVKLTNISTSEIGWIARLMNTTLPTGSNPDFVRPIGPVRFRNGKSVVMITPSGEVFKRA